MSNKLVLDFSELPPEVDLEPPPEGWHKVCEVKDHKWQLEIEEGIAIITCVDACEDYSTYDPSGMTPACDIWWSREDLSTPEPIAVELNVVDDSSPAGPWGPAEYGFWIDVRLEQPQEFFPPDEVVIKEMRDAHDRIVARNERNEARA